MLSPEENKFKQIASYLKPAEKAALVKYASEQGHSVAHIIAEAVMEKIGYKKDKVVENGVESGTGFEGSGVPPSI